MRSPFWLPWLLVGACGLWGCFPSSYLPPRDGRARVVWNGAALKMDFFEVPLNEVCAAAVREEVYRLHLRQLPPETPSRGYEAACTDETCSAGFWNPRLYPPAGSAAPDAVIRRLEDATVRKRKGKNTRVEAGRAGLPLYSPLLLLPLGMRSADLSMGSLGINAVAPRTDGEIFRGGVYATVIVVSAVLQFWFTPLALPAGVLGLLLDPEFLEDRQTGIEIDYVNIYNDLARAPGSPCASEAP